MKAVILVVVALCVVLGAHAQAQWSAGLSAQQKTDIYNTNLHHISNLKWDKRYLFQNFIKDLSQREIVIRLNHAIKHGHSVLYRVLEGDASKVADSAAKFQLKVESRECKCTGVNCCGRLIADGGEVVEANYVPSKRQNREGMPKEGGDPVPTVKPANDAEKKEIEAIKTQVESKTWQELENANRTLGGTVKLTDAQKQWYYDNNVAQVSKMNVLAQPYVKQLVDELRQNKPDTVLQLLPPIRNGHAVRYLIVEGDEAPVKSYAGKCGVQIFGRTIQVPGEKDVEVREAEDNMETDDRSHIIAGHQEENDDGTMKPINFVPTSQRNVVQALPDKWIKTSFRERTNDADSDDSVSSNDSDAFVQIPKDVVEHADTAAVSEDADAF